MPRSSRTPLAIDAEVGARIRLRRQEVGMSQSALGEELGVTFQQVQKYENGRNRVGAGRLQMIAAALGVAASYFFPEPDAASATAGAPMPADAARAQHAFNQISSPLLRKRALELLQAMADAQNTQDR